MHAPEFNLHVVNLKILCRLDNHTGKGLNLLRLYYR